jgi:hypothetical protein
VTSDLLTIEGDLSDVIDYYESQKWTDGLPIVPPTEQAVAKILAYTDLDPDDTLGEISPSRANATVLAVAINAVMAGCRPEYFPVVIAAVKGLARHEFNALGIQSTTNPVAVMAVVNGPIARELEFNGGGNCLGQGVRANATVGRAIRLCMTNIGGGLPQTMDKATQGQPGKYGMCIAENEAEHPWQPFHVEHGCNPGTSAVSLFSVTGTQNILDLASKSAVALLKTLASACATAGHQNIQVGGGPLIVLCPEHAQILAGDGFSKDDVRGFLYETSRLRVGEFSSGNLVALVRRRGRRFGSDDPESTIPLADSPSDIHLLVAGGPGPHSTLMGSLGANTAQPIVPIARKDGTPVESVRDFLK